MPDGRKKPTSAAPHEEHLIVPDLQSGGRSRAPARIAYYRLPARPILGAPDIIEPGGAVMSRKQVDVIPENLCSVV